MTVYLLAARRRISASRIPRRRSEGVREIRRYRGDRGRQVVRRLGALHRHNAASIHPACRIDLAPAATIRVRLPHTRQQVTGECLGPVPQREARVTTDTASGDRPYRHGRPRTLHEGRGPEVLDGRTCGGERDLGRRASVVSAADSHPNQPRSLSATPPAFGRVVESADPVPAFSIGDRRSLWSSAQLLGTVIDPPPVECCVEVAFVACRRSP